MDPLLTNRIDPSLMRVIEKRGGERDATPRRRRAPERAAKDEEKNEAEENPETKHALDDLA